MPGDNEFLWSLNKTRNKPSTFQVRILKLIKNSRRISIETEQGNWNIAVKITVNKIRLVRIHFLKHNYPLFIIFWGIYEDVYSYNCIN